VRAGGGLTDIQREAFGPAGSAPIWFWASQERKDVEVSLQGQPDGSYLIRSTANPNEFVLSVSETQRVSHYVIKRTGKAQYSLSDQTFPNLPELINFYRLHLLEETVLTMPLPPKAALHSGVQVTHFIETVKAKYNFNARDAEDLSFRKMDLLNVIEKHETEWWKAQHQRTLELGVIPAPYVEFVSDGPLNIAKKEADEAAEIYGTMVENGSAAAPPPRPGGAKPPSVPSRGNKPGADDTNQLANQQAAAKNMEQQRQARAAEQKRQDEAQKAAEEERARQTAEAERERQEIERKREAAKAANAYKAPERPKFIVAKAELDRQANVFDKSALTFKCGDQIHVKAQNLNGLWEGTVMEGSRRDRKGHFPFTFVEVQDSGAFDEETKKAEIAFIVTEMRKQGVDMTKLVKKGVDVPPPTAPPPRPVKPAAPAPVSATDDMVYGDGGDENAPPRPARPGAPKPSGGGPPPRPGAAKPPPVSASDDMIYGDEGEGTADGDFIYGDEDEAAEAQEIAEEEMIYGMADDFDISAVMEAADDIYGVL